VQKLFLAHIPVLPGCSFSFSYYSNPRQLHSSRSVSYQKYKTITHGKNDEKNMFKLKAMARVFEKSSAIASSIFSS